jgi:hypothetical protein
MTATNIKLAPYTASSEFAISGESPVAVTLAGRASLPYPPGNVKINGAAFPSTTSGDVTMTWNHRYRAGPFIVAQDAADVSGGPEGTYTVTVSVNGVLKHTTTGITGKTFTYTYAQRVIDDANSAHVTTLTITPVNGALVGTPRSLSFVMGP